MEINEKQHLQKTLDVITKKIEESQAKIKDASARLRLGVKELAENFHDMQSDLSNIYSSLADIESFEGELVKENKRLNLQKNTPYLTLIKVKSVFMIKKTLLSVFFCYALAIIMACF